jgi:transposase InsO family protein/transposase-like protein
VSHANAALTPRARLRLARFVVEEGHSIPQAAARFEVSYRTAQRWVQRYLELGEAGMNDRSSRPHRITKTPPRLVRKIVSLRRRKRWGPVESGDALGVPASTVHAVLTRCRLNRLSHLDRLTGERIRRYEHEHPGDLLHVDVKKLGNIPDGGGWRYTGITEGKRNRQATLDAGHAGRNRYGHPKVGTAFVHTVIDDHSRVAYAEIHNDEKAATAAAVLHRAVSWFADRGVTVHAVLSDNGAAYRSHLWRDTCTALAITPKRTRPYRPQTNGKIERFHRTLGAWAFDRFYPSEADRRAALPAWLHDYNHHRPHTAIGRQPPITRLTNLSGQHT